MYYKIKEKCGEHVSSKEQKKKQHFHRVQMGNSLLLTELELKTKKEFNRMQNAPTMVDLVSGSSFHLFYFSFLLSDEFSIDSIECTVTVTIYFQHIRRTF